MYFEFLLSRPPPALVFLSSEKAREVAEIIRVLDGRRDLDDIFADEG